MTESDISFEELERWWNPGTTGRGARDCIDEVIGGLAGEGVVVSVADVTRIGAAMWSALDNRGKPPGVGEPRHADEMRRLADAVGRHWPLISRTMLDGAQVMRSAQIGHFAAERGIAPLALLLTWRLMWWQWSEQRCVPSHTTDAGGEALDREFLALLRFWAGSSGASAAPRDAAEWQWQELGFLAEDWDGLRRADDVGDAIRILVSRSRSWRDAGDATTVARTGAP